MTPPAPRGRPPGTKKELATQAKAERLAAMEGHETITLAEAVRRMIAARTRPNDAGA